MTHNTAFLEVGQGRVTGFLWQSVGKHGGQPDRPPHPHTAPPLKYKQQRESEGHILQTWSPLQLNGHERELHLATFSAFAPHIRLHRQELQIKGFYFLSSDKMHTYFIHPLSLFPQHFPFLFLPELKLHVFYTSVSICTHVAPSLIKFSLH